MRNFASTLVKFSKLSHIQTTIWRPPKMAPPRTAGSAGPFVTPLSRDSRSTRQKLQSKHGYTDKGSSPHRVMKKQSIRVTIKVPQNRSMSIK